MITQEYRDLYQKRAEELVAQMTLEEKFSQMTFRAAAIPRLGIPAYNWWNEALHGVARAGVSTMFPQAIALAAMFDEEGMKEIADVIATEGRAKHHEYARNNDTEIYKGLTFWSPNVNIFRDPRWGRGHETYGEDPYLTSRMGVGFVQGLQGDDDRYYKGAACAKHFAVHSGPETLRHSFDAEVSQKDLWETYLPAFEALVKEAKVEAVMGAYNRTNGEPCCGSKTLMQDILRDQWGFDGHYVSDCWAIMDFHQGHHVTATAPESAAMAMDAGCDMNCGVAYLNLQIAYNEGRVTEEQIDRAVTRLMACRMRLGMFEDTEQVPYAQIPYTANDCAAHKALNLEASKKTMVLLKNKDNTLPFKKGQFKTIAVVGPNANNREPLKGNYFGDASKYTTVLEGLQDYCGDETQILYAKGCHMWKARELGEQNTDGEDITEAVIAAKHADAVVICLGLDATIEGEEMDQSNSFGGGDKYNLELPGLQELLLEKVTEAAAGKPVILLLLNGSALAVRWADEHVDAIVEGWYPGSRGGEAIAQLLFGEYSPAGRLPVTFYRTSEELPEFTDYSMKGRTYRYMETEALYPFGYGLSYTTFAYSNLNVSRDKARVTVTNTGNVDSDEVAQLYIAHKSENTVTPRWSLKGFKRVHLKAGESCDVEFALNDGSWATVQDDGSRVVEAGAYTVYVGGGQPDGRTYELTGREVLSATLTF